MYQKQAGYVDRSFCHMRFPPFPRRTSMYVFESPGKVQGVSVPHGVGDIADGQSGQPEKPHCFGHSVGYEKFLRRFAQIFTEYLSEIAAVQAAEIRDIFNRDLVLEIVFDKREGLFDIKSCSVFPGMILASREERTRASINKYRWPIRWNGEAFP